VVYQKTWEIAAELLARCGAGVPHGWVVGDDEFGRASEFRALLRVRGERYVLDVPCKTTIRDPEGRRPARKPGRYGKQRAVPFVRADTWAAGLPAGRWTRLRIRDGDKGPLEVEAVIARVHARLGRRVGPEERLLVIRTPGPKPELTYSLSNAAAEVALTEVVGTRSKRHRVERVFQEAKGEVGLAHYEVRSWVGWHHHLTLGFLALWFLILERRRIGGENPGGDGVSGESDLHPAAPQTTADVGEDRRGDQRCVAA